MLKLRKIKQNSRELFKKPFYQFEVTLRVIEDNYLFIGSSKDEIFQIREEDFEGLLDLDAKLAKIQDYIEPLSSSILLNGKAYIPGSTLKGMIRFFLEHSFKENDLGEIYSCFIKQYNPKPIHEIRNFLNIFNYSNFPEARGKEDTRWDRRTRKSPEDKCKVCDLFGNTDLASRVIFSDAVLLDDVKLEHKEIVAKYTDRKRVIPPNSHFSFTININNVTHEDLALLLIGMNLHNDGTLRVGMHKFSPQKNSLGEIIQFGKVRLNVNRVMKFSYDNRVFNEKDLDVTMFINSIKEGITKKFSNILRNFNESIV